MKGFYWMKKCKGERRKYYEKKKWIKKNKTTKRVKEIYCKYERKWKIEIWKDQVIQ